MFAKSAAFYDAIYSFKDYAAEARRIDELIRQYKKSTGDTLLDVACGTALHTQHLAEKYVVEGLDLDLGMLAVARRRCPETRFYQGDMVDFGLGKAYDVVICLFSSIGYVRTGDKLNAAITNMGRHLKPGGVLIVEPWFTPEAFVGGTTHARFIDERDLKLARMNVSRVEGTISILDFHYLVATPAGVEHFTERHELGLFTVPQYTAAFFAAGLETHHDREGFLDRGIFIGVRAG
jgi:ubiquinone/menaquinone biosynthesis C-methylase UbiE